MGQRERAACEGCDHGPGMKKVTGGELPRTARDNSPVLRSLGRWMMPRDA